MTSDLLMTSLPILLQGLLTTLILSVAAIVGGTLVGLLAAVLRTFGPWGTPRLARLYTELEQETGLATGFKRCGGVTVARTEDRMIQLRRTAATAGISCSTTSKGFGCVSPVEISFSLPSASVR